MNTTVYKTYEAPFNVVPTTSPGGKFTGIGAILFGPFLKWPARARQRRHLARLDSHLLEDIGVGPGEVWAEVNKPFWKA